MKITRVVTFSLRQAISRPTGPCSHYYRSREALLVKLETDTGQAGWGETAAFGGLRSLIEQQYAPRLVGRDPLEFRSLWRELWGQNFGSGLALGAVAVALDDLRGKALGVPVAELHGGRLRPRVPVYASALNYIEGEDPRRYYPEQARALVAQGFRAIKMRLGGQPIAQDVATAAAVREAVGPDVRLMADGNGAYSLGTAVTMGRELERLGFYWFEEPLPQNTPDYAGYEVLTAKLDIPIAAGEALTSRGMFKEAITRRAMAIVQPDVSLAGGIAECLFVAELARLWGIACMPHSWGGALVNLATAHFLAVLPDVSWSRTTETPMLELDLVENPFRDGILKAPVAIKDGYLPIPTVPGLGVEPDEEKLKFYADPCA